MFFSRLGIVKQRSYAIIQILAIKFQDCREKSMEENEQSKVVKCFKKGFFVKAIMLSELQTVPFFDARLVSASLPGIRRNDQPRDPCAFGSKGKFELTIGSLRSYLLEISTVQ